MVISARRRTARRVSIVLALVLANGLVFTPVRHAAAAPVRPSSGIEPTRPRSLLSFTSAPGDFIGQGRSLSVTPRDGDFGIAGSTPPVTRIDFDFTGSSGENWSLTVSAAAGDTLHVGSYPRADRQQFGRVAGLDFYGDGRGCNQTYGSFVINQLGLDDAGGLRSLDLTFVQHCETSTAPALRGRLLYEALPLTFSEQSEPGDPIGQGHDLRFTNGVDQVVVTTIDGPGFDFFASGHDTAFSSRVDPPTGATFRPGTTYAIADRPTKTRAELSVSIPGLGCDAAKGTLTIDKITYRKGLVTNVLMHFVQHCNGTRATLSGTLHYLD
jgi:hypothetical protein